MPKSNSTKNDLIKSDQDIVSTNEYASTLADLKKRIQECQLRAVTAANKELISLYWTIGKTIVEKQQTSGWGTSVIEKLAKDLQNEFPGVEGFSRSNIFRMKAFFSAYEKVAQAVRQFESLPIFGIPWGHNILLIQRIKNDEERLWYASKTIEHGWSRSILETWMESDLYNREGKALTNFKQTLPAPQSDLAQQTLKDPYLFDFITLHKDHLEKDLEDGLVQHIQKFLIELGHGFAFMGQQYPVVVDGDTSYIDLLFYHVKLRSFLVVEIKARAFKPEDVGQLNFYLSAVDDMLKHPSDSPTIGILLCKTRNKVKAEYAFRHIHRPMGVVEYKTMLTKALPEYLKSSLPTIQEIEAELEKD
jgi:predicted nuclease of restriction endonuclease-like (RecB) superfamily